MEITLDVLNYLLTTFSDIEDIKNCYIASKSFHCFRSHQLEFYRLSYLKYETLIGLNKLDIIQFKYSNDPCVIYKSQGNQRFWRKSIFDHCICNNRIEIMQWFIEQDYTFNRFDIWIGMERSFYDSVELETIQFLYYLYKEKFEEPFQFDDADCSFHSPFSRACEHGDLEIIKWMYYQSIEDNKPVNLFECFGKFNESILDITYDKESYNWLYSEIFKDGIPSDTRFHNTRLI